MGDIQDCPVEKNVTGVSLSENPLATPESCYYLFAFPSTS